MPNPSQNGAANGVLPAPSTILQKTSPAPAPRGGPRNTPPKPKLKFVIRRLPPGLTKAEAEAALGEEWKVGGEKVDWASFRKGKISTDQSKTSKPSRYFLHLTDIAHARPLSEIVKQNPFTDARNSSKDPVLIAPPSFEHALYTRTPGGRRTRQDARQGQIDQDPEYQDFLMSLTNPVNKPESLDTAERSKDEKVTTTPLIEHLREKKAAKEKPNNKLSKHARVESKDDKVDKKAASKKDTASPEARKKLSRKEAAKEAVKVLNKEAETSAKPKQENVPPTAPASEKKRERGSAATAKAMLQRDLGISPGPKGRRGAKRETPAETATKAIQAVEISTKDDNAPAGSSNVDKEPAAQDGAQPGKAGASAPRYTRAERRAHFSAKQEKEREEAAAKQKTVPAVAPTILRKPAAPAAATTTSNTASPPTAPKAPVAAPRGPAATRQPQATVSTPTASAQGPMTPSQPAKQGFLKHANASQGITEPLIETALSAFGVVEKVEIDKRKGFAYVTFVEPEGLQKAIAASPVKIAQGAVQVLERKDRAPRKDRALPLPPPGPPTAPRVGLRGGGFPNRGGRGGGRGGGPAGRGRVMPIPQGPQALQNASNVAQSNQTTAAPNVPQTAAEVSPSPAPASAAPAAPTPVPSADPAT